MILLIHLFSILWLPQSFGHIIRQSCSLTGDFSVIKKDFALDGYAIKTFEDLELEDCKNECIHHPLCKSINTKDATGTNCQISNRTVADPFEFVSLSPSPGWTFRSTNYTESNIGQLCQTLKPCPTGMTCKPFCQCPGYQCVSGIPNKGPFKSCADAYDQGFRETKPYPINLPNIGVIGVRCDMTTDGGGWIVFQRRIDNTTDFYRNWKEYKNGFGDLDGNFWLGLDKLHQLAGPGKQAILRVDLKHMDYSINKFAKYATFQVADESDDYRLAIGNYSGDASDSLRFQDKMKFSTKDNDNDLASWNCAVAYVGGWWYNSCHESNLNALYPTVSSRNFTEEKAATYMSWKYLTGKSGGVTFSEMKLKHVGL